MNKSKSTLLHREALDGWLYASPWIIGFFLFTLGPIVASFVLAFMKWDLVNPPRWIGLDNYLRMFNDSVFWSSLKVTAIYSCFGVPLNLFGSLILALLCNQKLRGIEIFRTIYYLPSVVSGVAIGLLWKWLFDPTFGLINYLLSLVGIEGPMWLASETWALPALIVMGLWGVGGGMVIFLAGLQGIPLELYEAAELDGANRWNKFWQITIPMLSPVIFFNLIMGIISSFQTFTYAYVMTGGGPNNATLFYVLNLYYNAFLYLRMGYASALAWFLFLVILTLTGLVFKSSPMWVYYESEVKGR